MQEAPLPSFVLWRWGINLGLCDGGVVFGVGQPCSEKHAAFGGLSGIWNHAYADSVMVVLRTCLR